MIFFNQNIFSENEFEIIGGIKIPKTQYATLSIEKYLNNYKTPFGKKQLQKILTDSENYRFFVRNELKKRNLPPVLEYLPVVESEYKATAVSKSGAKGLWQFMDNSIKGLLKKNEYIDERFDPYLSTKAALTKLEANYKQFKDWPLAIAAYNCGSGAMQKILKDSEEKTFWYIAENALLRDQSVQYIPKLLAICKLAENHELYELKREFYFFDFEYIETKDLFFLDRLSQELKMDFSILRELNPALIKNCTPPDEKYNLRIPLGKKESFLFAMSQINSEE